MNRRLELVIEKDRLELVMNRRPELVIEKDRPELVMNRGISIQGEVRHV